MSEICLLTQARASPPQLPHEGQELTGHTRPFHTASKQCMLPDRRVGCRRSRRRGINASAQKTETLALLRLILGGDSLRTRASNPSFFQHRKAEGIHGGGSFLDVSYASPDCFVRAEPPCLSKGKLLP